MYSAQLCSGKYDKLSANVCNNRILGCSELQRSGQHDRRATSSSEHKGMVVHNYLRDG
jgi:hypothetical protein